MVYCRFKCKCHRVKISIREIASGKNLQNKLSFLETRVYAYNFALLENKIFLAETKRKIKAALINDNTNEEIKII
jgi:hypothetical protein